MEPARVLLADDAPEMLDTVARLLCDDFVIVGSARNGEEALEAAASLAPDLVLLDI